MRRLLVSEPLILASGSPRRKELLAETGLPFTIAVSSIDETPNNHEDPVTLVQRLALEKAKAVGKLYPRSWIIGADTTVVIEGAILNKPEDVSDARRMLSLLQGKTHEVWSGLAVCNIAMDIEVVQAQRTRVTMVPLTADEIVRYVDTKEPMDKAGAYAMQGVAAQFVREINGSTSNVIGLDMCALIEILKSYNVVA